MVCDDAPSGTDRTKPSWRGVATTFFAGAQPPGVLWADLRAVVMEERQSPQTLSAMRHEQGSHEPHGSEPKSSPETRTVSAEANSSEAGSPDAVRQQERALLAAFAAGEADAVARVYRDNVRLVARVIARMGVTGSDVDDLIQTTFLEAVRMAPTFEGRSSLRGWLVAIALNQTRSALRATIRARRGAEQLHASPPPPVEGADATFSRARELDALRDALAKLPELQREAIVLCELEGLPAKEVSALLGVPAATVWRRVHDAKVSLRKLMLSAEGEAP